MEKELIEVLDEDIPSLKEFLTDLFVSNGIGLQALVTISLVGVLFAAWKAPRWVRKIGLTAPLIYVIAYLPGIIKACIDCLVIGPISHTDIQIGAGIFIASLIYGLIIYLIAVVIDLVQTPNK